LRTKGHRVYIHKIEKNEEAKTGCGLAKCSEEDSDRKWADLPMMMMMTTKNNAERFEVFTAVTMKNGVFWVVMPCGSCKNRRFGGTWRLLHQDDKNR
jgi:hypothetical protein